MFKTQYNHTPTTGEQNNQPSKTIPNQSKSIKEIFRLYASGQPISINPNLNFTGDEFVPNFEFMDPVERDEYLETIKTVKQTLDERQAEKTKQAADEKEAAEKTQFEELIKKYGTPTGSETTKSGGDAANATQ